MIISERVKKATELREKKEETTKRILELVRGDRRTVKEVSEIMGIPESSILALLK